VQVKEAHRMTVHLPEDLERYVRSQVQSGYFASEDEAIAEAVRLLRQLNPAPMLPRAGPLSEEELDRQLLQSGFLGSVPSRTAGSSTRRDFQPIPVAGEPLSETVIRERR
jgi:putative addiction module CopG family antidote